MLNRPSRLFIFLYIFSKSAVQNVRHQGKVCVLDIEIEGVKQIKNTDLNPILVFIRPPSILELERRLRGRKTETEDSLTKRLNTAKLEMQYGNKKYLFTFNQLFYANLGEPMPKFSEFMILIL